MARYLIIRTADGLVVNAVEWDGTPNWRPPSGHTTKQEDTLGNIGDVWDGLKFVPAERVEPPKSGMSVIVDILANKLVPAAGLPLLSDAEKSRLNSVR